MSAPIPRRPETLSVVIPFYNEVDTLGEIVRRVLASPVPFMLDVVLVDDGSNDGSRDVAEQLAAAHPEVRLFRQPRNLGKGAALRRGFAEVRGEIVLIQDADLEYNPADYPQLLVPILDGRADVVYGSRFLGSPHRVHMFWHYAGNRLLTLLSNVLNDLNLTDMETCYKAFRREVLDGLELRANRFAFEPEFTARVARRGLRIYEVPVSYSGRSYAEGKKITWRDGVSALWAIFRYRFGP